MTLTTPGALASVCFHRIEHAPAWYRRVPFMSGVELRLSGVDFMSVYDSNGPVQSFDAARWTSAICGSSRRSRGNTSSLLRLESHNLDFRN